ncbi:penicillin-binding protein [Virgibacillus profundi]|uniref:Penicillin-binding protein n=1 Tax=Virgibacillus profundi TaxID=2024555 RepID=A0A2A2IDS6_9BACI|nr:penicillin-binding protein 1A [Virgibacillus profundi]PAV29466.1 penicillin-binding protein [Virgibacillus profundi]PXY53635.1 penicillin-binding protein [Virgibacillus profundi]
MADNSQSRTARRKQKKSKKKPIWKKILLTVFIIFIVAGIGVGAVGTYWVVTAPEIDASKLSDPFSSSLYDQDGNEFAVLGSEKRKKIEYDDLPQVLIDAVIATEDARFFEHSGIDLRRIGGAIIGNIKNGFGSEGASTITQQVVEKSFLSHEKELKIKVQEQWLALKLEQDYSKEQILEMYLNKIFYSAGAYGVAKAAENYFGKTDLNDLTLTEAAILAGLPQRPTAYNPFENPDLTKGRMDTVLSLMVRHDKITEEQANEARSVDIAGLLEESRPDSTPYEGFIQQVHKEVKEKVDGADIYTDGLKIYTTLDTNVQEHVEFLLTDSDENPINYPDEEMQAAMVVLDTENGAIRAVGGRRNSTGNREFNYAINGKTQAGSTAKPIVAYGPAIEYNKISTYHQINDDKPYEVGEHTFRNWNRKYSGWMTARHALVQSLNVPALKTLEATGTGKAKEFAEGLGYHFADDTISIGDAIGGTQTQVTPLQLAGSYRAFGNEGIYNEPYAVTKVEFEDGRTVELKPEPEAAMSDYTAYMITDMLKSAITDGFATAANVPGLHVAGKTGTTNLKDVSGSPDSWFAGYTTNYTISAWVGGYTDEDGNRAPIPDGGTTVPQYLFSNTMTEISKEIETADFKKPSSVVEVRVEKGSNPAALPSEYTPSSETITELFVKGTEPTKTSEKYDELDPVDGLEANYNEDSNSIDIEWNYDSDEDISFNVSASVNGGQMQDLSSTEDTSMEITEVEPGAAYEIQVIASNRSMQSEPKTTNVTVPGEDEEEEEEENEEESEENEEDNNGGNIPPVSGLSAQYVADRSIIDVSWGYNGPPATFEVSVNGQTQTVQSNGIEISGASPGQVYTINVTPIGQNGANEGVRGQPQSTEVTVPEAPESDQEGNEGGSENPNEEEQGQE